MPIAKPQRRPMYNRLREVRTAQGVSRSQLAEAVEVNVQTIGALERGQYSPSLYLALMIAEALDAGIDELFGLTD